MPRTPSIEKRHEGSKGGVLAIMIVTVLIIGVMWAMSAGGPPSESEAGQLLAQTGIAVGQITKESFTFEGTIETSSDAGYMGLSTLGEGRIDSENRRMYLRVNFESPVTETGSIGGEGATVEIYAIDNDIYTSYADVWGKHEAGERLWGDKPHFSQKLADLAGKFDAEVTQKEVVNGRPTFKLVVNPTMEELTELMLTMDPGLLTGVELSDFQNIDRGIRAIEMTLWIDAEEFIPIKAEFLLEAETMTLNPAGSGVAKSDIVVSATVNFDHKTPFNIVLPSDAQDAVEI